MTSSRLQATSVHVKFTTKAENGDWLWAINGHSGVDLYVQDAASAGQWRWATSSGNNPGATNGSMHKTPGGRDGTTFTATLGVMAQAEIPRNFTLYLPSRGNLHSVSVGVAPGSMAPKALAPPAPAAAAGGEKPVVVYGTSILHGAAAGRAGMVYSSQMQRYLQKPVVNLGFSGHGLMQKEVGATISEIDASIFVLDCEYNMDQYTPAVVECLAYEFIKDLRAARPGASVLLVEGHDHTNDWMEFSTTENSTRNAYRRAYNRVIADGDKGVFYLNGSLKLGGLIATDFEAQAGP